MKKISFIILTAICVLSFSNSFAQDQEQRIQTSYILAFNKKATADEVTYWKSQGNLNVGQLLARHKAFLVANPGIWDGILRVSYTDAFGRAIAKGERDFHIGTPRTYAEMMAAHMQYLNQNPGLYDEVIKKSYSGALGRQPNNDELKYWRGQKKAAYIWLFRAHVEWIRSNSLNSKVSLSGVTFLPISPAVANEAQSGIASLVGNDGASLIGNDGSTLVAAGGGNLVAAGGGNVIAAGGN